MATDVNLDPVDPDERLGEAIEAFMELVESGEAPDPDDFAAQYPDLGDDLREALEGLSLVRGLVGSTPGGGGARLMAGRRLAGYKIVGELGSGGMGVVYEAVHVDLDRPVALKVLDARATRDGNGLRRFLNEAKLAAALHHTHIVPVFDVGHVGGLCYYAMQRIEGAGVDRVIKSLRRDRTTGAGSGIARNSTPPPTLPGRTAPLPRPDYNTALDRSGLADPALADTVEMSRSVASKAEAPSPFQPPRGAAYYRWVAELGREAASALAYAHEAGVIHRDIKPSNLLVDAHGRVWIADFGLARRLTDPGITRSDNLIGTPRYMSPEQARSGPLDGRTDEYSLGATLYELLTLRPPFEGRTTAELIEQITRDEPITPSRFDPRIPRDLETIILKALAKRPGDRYDTAAELAEDLNRYLHHEPVRARRIGPFGRFVRLVRRHPAISTVTASAAAVVLVTATVSYLRVLQERDRAVSAEGKLQEALRENLLNQASLVRLAAVPGRRERGLGWIREAAAMKPDADLAGRLRDEAVTLLTLRDVERRADVVTPRASGMAFDPDGHLEVVSEDGHSRLAFNGNGQPMAPAQPTGPDSPNSRPPFGLSGARLATLGDRTATIWPDGHGLRLHATGTATPITDIPLEGREILAVHGAAGPKGARLVTVDRARPEDRPPPPENASPDDSPPPPPRDADRYRNGFTLRVTLWDPDHPSQPLATLEPPPFEETGRTFPLVAIAPDGDTVAVCWFRSSTVGLWSADDGTPQENLDATTSITALALGPDDVLATAGSGAIRLWRLSDRTALPSLTPDQAFLRMLRFSPDGTLLALAGGGPDIELWDPASNTLVAALPTSDRVTELAFSPDGAQFAAVQPAGIARWAIVEPTTRSRVATLDVPPASLAFAPQGRLALAFRNDAPARLWHPGRGATAIETLDGSAPSALALDHSGRLAALAGDTLVFYDLSHSDFHFPVSWLNLPTPPAARGRAFPGNMLRNLQTMVASADGHALALLRLQQILLWKVDSPNTVATLNLPLPALESPPENGGGPPPPGPPPPEPPPPAPTVAMKKANGDATKGDGEPTRRFRPPWSHAALGPNGSRLYLLSSWSGEFHAWNLEGNAPASLPWEPPQHEYVALALSPDGKTLTLATRDARLLSIDTRTGTARTLSTPTTNGVSGTITALAYGPKGDLLAAGTREGPLFLYRPSNLNAPPLRLPGHRGLVLTLAFDASGRWLASGSDDKTVAVWDLNRLRTELARLALPW